MKLRVSFLLTSALLLSAPALAQDEDVLVPSPGPVVAPLPPPGQVPMAFRMRAMGAPLNGIPPHLVEKLGVPRELAQRVQDASFESNEALIPLEADLKRAQLRLERLLQAPSPDESAILRQVEEVGRAETAVRRNRIGLMVHIKKLLGPDLWQKLEAEMGPVRFEQRIEAFRGAPGEPARRALPPPPPARQP
jgi:hypothetical protein